MLNVSSFSSDGYFLAGCVSTSSVRFWNSDSSAPSQEFVPSSNLSSACSCINWINFSSTQEGAHSVAITSLASSLECDELYSAATDGVVGRWSLTKSVLLEKWKAEKHAVHSLCVCPTSRVLLTASRKLKLWNIDTQQLLCTFGAHTSKIICVRELLPSISYASPPSSPLPNANNWSFSRSDLFYVSAASQDRHLYLWRVPSVDAESGEKSDASDHSTPLASFALSEEPLVFTLAQISEQVFIVAAVTVSGQLLFFEYTLNGSRSNSSPISPVKWVCVERENARRKHRRHQQSSGPIVDSLPVVNVHLISVAGGALEVLFAFGNELSLVIERLRYEQLNSGENRLRRSMDAMDASLTLVSDSSSTALANNSGVSIVSTNETLKVKQPVISKDSTTFAAGFCAPVSGADTDPHASVAVSIAAEEAPATGSSADVSALKSQKSKRKRLEDSTMSVSAIDMSIGETSTVLSRTDDSELLAPVSLEHRAPAPSEADQRAVQRVAEAAGSGSGGASSDALVFLLRQALQSGDAVLLKAALDYHHSQVTIVNTVRRMAADLVLPLIQVISLRLQDKSEQSNFRLLFWLKTVLTAHMAYLASQSAMVGQMSGLLQLFGSRTALLGEWCRLQGKLQLVLDQTGQRRDAVEASSLKAGTRAIVGSLPLPGGVSGAAPDSAGALIRLTDDDTDRGANTTAVYYSASEEDDGDDESDLVSVHDAFALDDLDDEDFDLLSDDAGETDQPEFETSAFHSNVLVEDQEKEAEESSALLGEDESAAEESDPNVHSDDSEQLPEFIAVGSAKERAGTNRDRKKAGTRGGGGERSSGSPAGARPLRSACRPRKISCGSSAKQNHKHSKKQRY